MFRNMVCECDLDSIFNETSNEIYMERNNILEKSILKAAEKLFLEKGFAHTTTTMIANEAGCNQSLIHYYFRTKEKLFQLVFEKYVQIFIVGLSNIANKSLTFEDQIKDCVYKQFEMFQKKPQIAIFLMTEISYNPICQKIIKENLATYTKEIEGIITSKLKVEIINGNIRPITLIDLILNIFTLNASVFLFYVVSNNDSLFTDEELQVKLEQSKHSNYTLIMRSLKINLWK